MRWWIFLFHLEVLLYLLLFPLRIWADDALELADYLFEQCSYEAAIIEYKRFIFFNPEDERAAAAYYHIALAHRARRRWPESIEAFKAAIQRDSDPVSKEEKRLGLAIALIAAKQYNAALHELEEMIRIGADPALRRRVSYLQGVAHLYQFNWEEARRVFGRFYSASEDPDEREEGEQIDSLLREAELLPNKSERQANMLSAFLPGAGQAYAGEWKKGFNALALNSLITFFIFHSAAEGDYGDAGMLLVLMCKRYYYGNRYHAEKAVRAYNDRLARQQAARIMSILLRETAD